MKGQDIHLPDGFVCDFITVVGHVPNKRSSVFVRCVCGKEWEMAPSNILNGNTRSCGCKKGALRVKHGWSHGFSAGDKNNHGIYASWRAMCERCNNPNSIHFHHYGGRGIKVCERWVGKGGFDNFLADMGDRPEGTFIERTDNDGNYEPGNCRWVTRKEQSRNKRTTRRVLVKGQVMCATDAAELLDMCLSTIYARVHKSKTPITEVFSLDKSLEEMPYIDHRK